MFFVPALVVLGLVGLAGALAKKRNGGRVGPRPRRRMPHGHAAPEHVKTITHETKRDDIEARVAEAIATGSAETMERVADELERAGHPSEAAELRKFAAEVRGVDPVPDRHPHDRAPEEHHETPPPAHHKTAEHVPPHHAPTPYHPPPDTPADRIYTVQAGDSLWKIAEHFTGDGGRGEQLARANEDKRPRPEENIWKGEKLRLPASWPSSPGAPEHKPEPEPEHKAEPAPEHKAEPHEDPGRARAQALTAYLKSIGGLAGRFHEDKERVRQFQAAEGLTADGLYGPGAAMQILEGYGIIPVAPFHWSRTHAADQKSVFLARVRELASGDPERSAEYDALIRDTERS